MAGVRRPALVRPIATLVLLLALAAPWLASCGRGAPDPSSPAAKPVRGGTLVVGSISDVDSWNEYLSRQTFANDLLRRIYLRLAQPQGDSREHPPTYEPALAESWTFSPDGRTLTFRLREAVWSDGVPVTSDDVRFTWTAQTSPEVAWSGASGKSRIRDVKALDPRTVAFELDAAYPDALPDAVDGGILPRHVFGAVPFPLWRTHDWSTVRIGSGPFVLDEHLTGEEIAIVRNPRYFRQDAPRVDRVVVRIVPDIANLITQLQSGAVDYLEGIPPRDAERVRATPGVTLASFDEPKYDYIGWNGSLPPFDDPRVRKALTLAVDREALVDDLLFGFGRVSRGPILSFWWGADRDLAPWPYDPEQARRLLREAGFAPGPDGTLARGGEPLDFEMTTNAGNRLRESMLVKIQEQLARIGARATPRPLENKTFVQRNLTGKYQAYLAGWRFSGKIDLRSIFHSASIPEKGNNVVFYRSAALDSLLDDLDRTADWKAMVPVLRDVQRRIHDDAPYPFLYETQRIAAAGKRLHGLRIDVPSDPLARLETYWVEP